VRRQAVKLEIKMPPGAAKTPAAAGHGVIHWQTRARQTGCDPPVWAATVHLDSGALPNPISKAKSPNIEVFSISNFKPESKLEISISK
jgi:hypothetical protein